MSLIVKGMGSETEDVSSKYVFRKRRPFERVRCLTPFNRRAPSPRFQLEEERELSAKGDFSFDKIMGAVGEAQQA